MKRYLKILSVIALVFAMSITAFGADNLSGITVNTKVDDAKESITICASMEDVKYGDLITVELLKKDKKIDSLADSLGYTGEQLVRDFVIYTQVASGVNVSDEKNNFEVVAGMKDEPMGNYLLRVNGKDVKEIFHVPAQRKRELMALAEESCKKDKQQAISELEDMITAEKAEDNLAVIFVSYNAVGKDVDATLLAECIYNLATEDEKAFDSISLFGSIYSRAVNIAALDSGIGDVVSDKENYSLDEDYVKIYNEQLSNDQKNSFTKTVFSGKKLTTAEEVALAFREGVIEVFAKGINSWGDAKILVETFGEDMGLDMNDYEKLSDKDKLYTYIVDLNATDIRTISDNINKKIKKLRDSEKESGKGSGSSGGGGGGGTGAGGYVNYAPIVAPVKGFSDMVGYEWANEAVNYLRDNNIVSGIGNNMFAPGREITREEMLAMLLRAYNVDTTGAESTNFEDVDASAWYAPYISKAYEIGVVKGLSDTEFGIGRYITREEVAVMADRIASLYGKTFIPATEVFADDDNISPWAKDSVYSLKGSGIISGMGDGTFAPKANCNRSQAAQIIYVLIKK